MVDVPCPCRALSPVENVTRFHTNKDTISAAILLSRVKKPSHLSPGRSPQRRSGWPQVAPHPQRCSPPSLMREEAVKARRGRVGSISLADAQPGSAEGSPHPGLPPAPLPPSSPAGSWPIATPQTLLSPQNTHIRCTDSGGLGLPSPYGSGWLRNTQPQGEKKNFVFSPAHNPGDLH